MSFSVSFSILSLSPDVGPCRHDASQVGLCYQGGTGSPTHHRGAGGEKEHRS